VMPFISEAIWATLHDTAPETTRGEPLLIGARWPTTGVRDVEAESAVDGTIEVIRDYRDQRTKYLVPASEWRAASVLSGSNTDYQTLIASSPYVEVLGRVRLDILKPGSATPPLHGSNTRLGVTWLKQVDDPQAAATRRARKSASLHSQINRLRTLLAGDFIRKAPPAVVEKERTRLAELEEQLRQLDEQPASDSR
jgi:valyl-tRNA synthetase